MLKTLLIAPLVLASVVAAGTGRLRTVPRAAPVTNVVLVHGAFADGSSYAKVIPLLQQRGAVRTEYTGTTLREHLREF